MVNSRLVSAALTSQVIDHMINVMPEGESQNEKQEIPSPTATSWLVSWKYGYEAMIQTTETDPAAVCCAHAIQKRLKAGKMRPTEGERLLTLVRTWKHHNVFNFLFEPLTADSQTCGIFHSSDEEEEKKSCPSCRNKKLTQQIQIKVVFSVSLKLTGLSSRPFLPFVASEPWNIT